MTQSSANPPVEKRLHVRYALTGMIPASLISERGDTFEAVTVDVSPHGLGLLLEPSPEVGEVVTFTLVDHSSLVLRFEVRWCRSGHDFEDIGELKDMRRCGLKLLTRGIDLLAIFGAIDGMTIEE